MEPSDEDIRELRQRALAKVEADGQNQYHLKDIERLKTDNSWLRRFLLHHELDQDKALDMIMSTLAWRQSFGANDITHNSINLQHLCGGAMFPCNRDKDGKKMFIIKVKNSVKGSYKPEESRRCLVYWFERLEREEKGERISVFFEMTDAGLSNMDMDFVQYLIQLFRDYYPYFLNYIIIFEMPWILNAAWKLVKSWMPPKSVEMVKFVGRSSLKDLVPIDQQLVEWGGTCSYHFLFQPETLSPTATSSHNGPVDESKKKVHFAEDTAAADSSSGDLSQVAKKPLPGQLLQLIPAEEIVFRREAADTVGVLSMENVANCAVAYKIKTTSPEKYRVRPSAGVLSPGETLSVSVHIQSGYSAAQLVRDKFLVMACAAESESLNNQQLAELWKSSGEAGIQQHRLRCTVAPSDARDEDFAVGGSGPAASAAVSKSLEDLRNKVDALLVNQDDLRGQLKAIRRLLLLLVVLAVAAPIFLLRAQSDDSPDGFCHKINPN